MNSNAVSTIAEGLGPRQQFLDEVEKQRQDIEYGLSLLKAAKEREERPSNDDGESADS